MGVGAGGFRMKNVQAKTADSADLKDQERDLTEAYSQSANQDKTIAAEFDVTLTDGIVGVQNTRKDVNAAQ